MWQHTITCTVRWHCLWLAHKLFLRLNKLQGRLLSNFLNCVRSGKKKISFSSTYKSRLGTRKGAVTSMFNQLIMWSLRDRRMYATTEAVWYIGLAKLFSDQAHPSCTRSRHQTFSGMGQSYQGFSIPEWQRICSTILLVDTRAIVGPAMWTFQEVPWNTKYSLRIYVITSLFINMQLWM